MKYPLIVLVGLVAAVAITAAAQDTVTPATTGASSSSNIAASTYTTPGLHERNGWFVDRTIRLFEKHGNSIGIRISIEGLAHANDGIRGMPNGFDHALRILTTLHRMGVKDIGFGLTVQDVNAGDVKELHELAKMMNVEFATAALHNSFYFHKQDNRIASLGFPDPGARPHAG